MIKKRGFTLIEIIVTLGLVGMISTMAFSIVNLSNKSLKIGEDEFDIQSATRIVSEKINNTVRYATAVFEVPATSFKGDNLTAGWNYLGIETVPVGESTGSQIVNYVYDKTTGNHVENILYEATEGVVYSIQFYKSNDDTNSNLLKFKINCSINGGSETSIITELEDLNALQVVNLGTDSNPATAIAYRSDERSLGAVANVAMVLDVSGSMSETIRVGMTHDWWGRPRPNIDYKISVLQNEACGLIEGFAEEDNIDVAVVPFSTTANSPKDFLNAKNDKSRLENYINRLSAYGGTNTGDGLRRAYYLLNNHKNVVSMRGVTPVNYVILLVDGETTFATKKHGTDLPRNWYYYHGSDVDYYNSISIDDIQYEMGDGDVVDGRDWWDSQGYGDVIGIGNQMHSVTDEYVNKVGAWYNGTNFAKVYLIAFGNNGDRDFTRGIQKLKASCGISDKYTFNATDENTLNKVFEEIRQDIFNDLWYLTGPRL